MTLSGARSLIRTLPVYSKTRDGESRNHALKSTRPTGSGDLQRSKSGYRFPGFALALRRCGNSSSGCEDLEFPMHIDCLTENAQPERNLIRLVLVASIAVLLTAPVQAKTVVFWQPGFPTVASQPVERASLAQALDGVDAQFADLKSLNEPATLSDADLLILPYGSAFPTGGWKAIEDYLHAGGNLLIVGGQPLRVPVVESRRQVCRILSSGHLCPRTRLSSHL
jgi:hypothetical protein